MASTYTDELGLEKQANGENNNTWGTQLNTVLDNIDKAVANRLSKDVAGSSNVTLTASEALNAYHEYTGTLTGNIDVIVPGSDKIYFIYNNTSGSYTLTVKTSGGTGIAVPQGTRTILYCDTTNVDYMLGVATTFDLSGNPIVFTKGGDIASASPLVIDTDGSMFDVTGTTGFSAMTVVAGTLFMLQFDGALTMTHGAGTLDLPFSKDITTVAGGHGLFYATAANVVRCIAYSPFTKAEAAASWGMSFLDTAAEWTAAQNFNQTTLTFDATQDWDWETDQDCVLTLTANTTFDAPTNIPAGRSARIKIIQDGTGTWTVAWNAVFDFADGSAPTITATAGAYDVLTFYSHDGTNVILTGIRQNGS